MGPDVVVEDLTPEAAALVLDSATGRVARSSLCLHCLSCEMETAFSAFSGILQGLALMALITLLYTASHLGHMCDIV